MDDSLDLDPPFSLVRMFWGNIAARPLRCALSVIAIAIQVILVLMIVGLTSGMISEWGKRVEGVGADIMVQPPNASIFIAFSSAVMPESLGDQIGFGQLARQAKKRLRWGKTGAAWPRSNCSTEYEVWGTNL